MSTLADRTAAVLRRLTAEHRERGASRLPTERELAAGLGVSRTTLRSALDRLVREGDLRRGAGRKEGMFVTGVIDRPEDAIVGSACGQHTVCRDLNTVKGVPEMLNEQGYADSTTVLSARIEPAPRSAARALGLPPGSSVTSLRRVRYADGEPLSLEQLYLGGPHCERYLSTRLDSLYAGLRTDFGLVITAARETITLAVINASAGSLLQRTPGSTALRLERVAYDQARRPVEYSVDLFRADRTELRVHAGA
ncbi:GntR family transcriptional regulator [Naumannella cuiyingiana]|uniref:GntR family transcriptional regulator n=1 Tax=Naumannella cuiyingiana TaxID=1347891 RepID=A0A7Z0IKU9_9ACTN|nr:GntR family transcriptional regulator [Naumannella cuiyingiana]NYI70970.1 GntR family transcriptional regulator [Naumannella cuiyingiana]